MALMYRGTFSVAAVMGIVSVLLIEPLLVPLSER